nr:MFS transporter [Actinomadura rugatobispora]
MARRAALAGFVGTFIEYYDFALYGVLTVFLAPQFFPSDNASTSFLAGLAVFGAGFVARPIGGILFGRYGDRRGRRNALVLSVLLMGVCSTLVGILPTYATLGALAPLLLVLLRLGQGISAGSEMLGSITYVLESVPRRRRVFMASLTSMGAVLGGATSTVTAAVLTGVLGRDGMEDYGWRIAFLIAAPLTAIALWIRTKLEDSPEFTRMIERREVTRSPLREVLTVHRRNVLIAGGIAISANGAAGLAAWFHTYLVGNRDLPGGEVFAASAVSSILSAFLAPVAGRLADRYGQRRTFAAVLVGYLVAAFPVMYMLGKATGFAGLIVALGVYSLLVAMVQAPAFTLIAELFPGPVRYTGANFGQNIGTVLASGLAPFAAGLLFTVTGSSLGPVIWIFGVCAIAFVALSVPAVQYVAGADPAADPGDAIGAERP